MSEGRASALWNPAIQSFQTWLKTERVPGSHGEHASRLVDFVPAGEIQDHLRKPGTLEAILDELFPSGIDPPSAQAIVDRYSVVFAL